MWLFVDLSQLFKKNTGGAIVLALLCLYPYIQLFHYVNYCSHKNQIDIGQTVCHGFTWDGDRYYNGVDRLDFSVDVRFKNKEVAYMVIHTVVRKDGRYVGYIKTEFTGNCTRMEENTPQYYFEKRTRQTLDFYMEHITGTSWSGEELMQELYNGNLEGYTFDSDVIYATFADGTIVGVHLFLDSDFYYDEKGKLHVTKDN